MRKYWTIALCLSLLACNSKKKPIYLDYQATTPCDERVLKEMEPFFYKRFGNPSSPHQHGIKTKEAVDQSRSNISSLINSPPDGKVIFTSGATESNNTLLKGLSIYFKAKGKNHIITSAIEHKSILNVCKTLEDQGFKITYLPVQSDGSVDPVLLEKSITPQTFLVSIMMVNNEIGIIQPIKKIGKICKKHNVIFHTDGAQAIGKIPIDVVDMNIDALSISGHKIYGPKGIGALYLSDNTFEKLLYHPLMEGGQQEFGLRSGTTPVPLCVGLGRACKIAQEEMLNEFNNIAKLRQYLYNCLKKDILDIETNSNFDNTIPGCLSLRIPKANRSCKRENLDNVISISSGSACGSGQASHVIKAIGIDEDKFYVLRIGIGRFTTKEDIDIAIKAISKFYS